MAGPDRVDAPPVFVVGTPRSGTTLTARMLGAHPRVFMPAETHFFDDIYARRGRLGRPGSDTWAAAVAGRLSTIYKRQHEGGYQKRLAADLSDTDALHRLIDGCRNYRAVLSRFMEAQMAAAGKARWGNQVPRDIFNTGDIVDFYPDARVIVCIRDPRDFLASYGAMKSVVRPHHVGRHQRLFHPVVTSLLWLSTVRRIPAVERQLRPGNFLVLRYEDLVGDPAAAARRICALIGEDFDPAMLAVRQNNSSDGAIREAGGGIYATSVGRWRQALPPEQAWLAQRIAGRWLAAFGYLAEPVSANPLRVAALVLGFPVALARGLHANRGKRGALLPYLARRVASLLRTAG